MQVKRFWMIIGLLLMFIAVASAPAIEVAKAEAPAQSDKMVIAGVVFQSDTFMQTVQAGMQAAADEAGVELILGNTENDLAKESSMIDDYITRGVNAIVITPISSDGSVAALKKAKEAGITIVCFNTCVSEEGIASAFLVTKNEDLGSTTGKAAVKFIEEKLDGKATIGILNCDQFEGCPPRKEGFLAEVSQLPGVKVVADQAGWIADAALPVSEAMLEANPTINLLWAANEGGTVGHALAVKSAGLAGEVFVFGTDMNDQMAQMLQADDDVLQGVTGQAPYQMGFDSLNTTLAVLKGEKVEAEQNTPTIFFGRGDDAMINKFVETGGNAVFEVPMKGDFTVAGVVFQSDTFMQTVQAGMQAAADEMGSELILGNTENDLAKESSMIDDYITRGVDAIVITPISSDGSVAALKKAKEAGITVICFNTCVSKEGIASAFLVTKNEDLGSTTGKAAVKFIEEKLDGKATIGILNCDQFEGCPPRKEGFLAEVSQLPGVKVVADQAGWIADAALPVSEAMLEANPTINLLWAANEGGTVGHALAVKSAGLAGEVFVFGTDMNDQMAQMLQADDDVLQGVTGQAPYQMGFDAFMTTIKTLNGQVVEAEQNTPTIFFGRGDDEMINKFLETGGNAIFETEAKALPFKDEPYTHPSGAFTFGVPESFEEIASDDASASFGNKTSIVGAAFTNPGVVFSNEEMDKFIDGFMEKFMGSFASDYKTLERKTLDDGSIFVAVEFDSTDGKGDADFIFEQRDTAAFVLYFATFAYDEMQPTWSEIIDSYSVDSDAAIAAAPPVEAPAAPAKPTPVPQPTEEPPAPAGPSIPAGKGMLIMLNCRGDVINVDVIPVGIFQELAPKTGADCQPGEPIMLDPGDYTLKASIAGQPSQGEATITIVAGQPLEFTWN